MFITHLYEHTKFLRLSNSCGFPGGVVDRFMLLRYDAWPLGFPFWYHKTLDDEGNIFLTKVRRFFRNDASPSGTAESSTVP